VTSGCGCANFFSFSSDFDFFSVQWLECDESVCEGECRDIVCEGTRGGVDQPVRALGRGVTVCGDSGGEDG